MSVRKEQGFTLVEVIVVAVIVAVLAAVAIPLYMGYIKDSRINVANNTAGTVASQCGATKQQNSSNVVTGTKTEGEVFSFNGENGVPNNVMIPLGYNVTVTATGVYCNSTKDATCYSKVFNY
jgi:prepilin-type N-terminal cleavage/methylation domain-containing protein